VGAVLPWHQLWARTVLGLPPEQKLTALIAEVKTASSKAANISYREESWTSDEIAKVWLDVLVDSRRADSDEISQFNQWIDALKRPLFTTTLTSLARLCARTPNVQSESFRYASRAFALSKDAREHAASISDTYVEIARALIAVSKYEAAVYFDRAVEVASKIGDENLDRWHFDWEATVRAITALCPSTSFAILSRWRDRNFGSAERLLPAAVEFLLSPHRINPKAALCLIGFRAEWDSAQLLSEALNVCGSGADKADVFTFAYGYMRLEEHGPSMWRKTAAAPVFLTVG
jgi:hypothetical protein